LLKATSFNAVPISLQIPDAFGLLEGSLRNACRMTVSTAVTAAFKFALANAGGRALFASRGYFRENKPPSPPDKIPNVVNRSMFGSGALDVSTSPSMSYVMTPAAFADGTVHKLTYISVQGISANKKLPVTSSGSRHPNDQMSAGKQGSEN
jgi:hypothetical protein